MKLKLINPLDEIDRLDVEIVNLWAEIERLKKELTAQKGHSIPKQIAETLSTYMRG